MFEWLAGWIMAKLWTKTAFICLYFQLVYSKGHLQSLLFCSFQDLYCLLFCLYLQNIVAICSHLDGCCWRWAEVFCCNNIIQEESSTSYTDYIWQQQESSKKWDLHCSTRSIVVVKYRRGIVNSSKTNISFVFRWWVTHTIMRDRNYF